MMKRFLSLFKSPGPTASLRRRLFFSFRTVWLAVGLFLGVAVLGISMPKVAAFMVPFMVPATLAGAFIWVIVQGYSRFVRSYRKKQHVGNTPTSKIGSAAQGYVELAGTVMAPLKGELLLSPLSQTPCVWWGYKIELGDQIMESGQSTDALYLMDDTGLCIIHPQDATIIDEHQTKKWKGIRAHPQKQESKITAVQQLIAGQFHYTERFLLPGQTLYVLGDFVMEKPADGRPFLISGKSEAKVVETLRWDVITGIVGILFIFIYLFWIVLKL